MYDTVARQFCQWLVEHDRPIDPRDIGKRDIEDFVGYMIETRSASTANVAYRALQQWWKWMVTEGEIERSPMERTSPPSVPEKAVPVLSIEQLRALLDVCKGRELVPLRDTAIIRLLLDSGGRLGEVAGLAVDDLDFEMDVAHGMGKGRRPRALPFGDKTATADPLSARSRAGEAGGPA
ncbi:MAG: tyrosine-type recombinase/integrase [Pseudonocardiaceae bacterium]